MAKESLEGMNKALLCLLLTSQEMVNARVIGQMALLERAERESDNISS